ncbi:halocarboxylic acid dehydrogenase DehI family protein [Ruegeria sp. MALMAid1280]|uniref:halocarboxylic acid dehydrogenase DehI family protein n=1 Tax=Ruegeria sp. MALMAid1280 TaxID=3411634 RepID=UPI003BA20C86
MTPDQLQRLKPNPIPPIHPVPERAATADLARVYDRTKRGFGVPWMGVVAMAFAHYPEFYQRLWSSIEPVVATNAFGDACRELRECAEAHADAFAPPTIGARLAAIGYDAIEVRQIIACNEVFSAGNMPYLLLASLARALLEEHEWTGRGQGTALPRPAEDMQHPVLMEPHHADPETAALYDDIRETLGLPFVNTDYRAFARWPSYFALAWHDLKPVIQSAAYEPAVSQIHSRAAELAVALPNVTGLSSEDLIEAAARDADPVEVLAVVQLFQWLLPGLAFNVAFFRAQLTHSTL